MKINKVKSKVSKADKSKDVKEKQQSVPNDKKKSGQDKKLNSGNKDRLTVSNNLQPQNFKLGKKRPKGTLEPYVADSSIRRKNDMKLKGYWSQDVRRGIKSHQLQIRPSKTAIFFCPTFGLV
ncbi:MAG: hypothetical protein D3922_16470 [Candidatus Electrothrix sp. AR1]|nr:hypothetical protein [Candidatus Electrothrix sp. AR1]